MNTPSRFALLAASLLALSLAQGCGAAAPSMRAEGPSAAQAPAPVALDRSLFSRDMTGAVGEPELQRILQSSVDVTFPVRVGVVALDDAFRAESRASVGEQGLVAGTVTRSIKGATWFSHVTDVSTELPNPQGLEGLRTIAARYRLRYLLLCSAHAEDTTHLNNWAWLYPTGLGVLLAPGVSVGTQGMLQASLFDVKNGTVLFTVTEPYETSSMTWLIGSGREHTKTDGKAMGKAAERLARGVLAQTEYVAHWAESEREAARANKPPLAAPEASHGATPAAAAPR